jgi:hypothetical protein
MVNLVTAKANVVAAGIAVGYLRGFWNDYNCGTSQVVAGPYYHPVDGGDYSTAPPPTHDFRCAEETWNISWDGGHSWEPTRVNVCQFVS